MSKQREFWIDLIEKVEPHSWDALVFDKKPITKDEIHVRQVSPEYDRAVEGLVEAIEKELENDDCCCGAEEPQGEGYIGVTCYLHEALANFAKAREGK